MYKDVALLMHQKCHIQYYPPLQKLEAGQNALKTTELFSRPEGVNAQSPILNTAITVDRLVKRGYEPLIAWYRKVAPVKFTPLLFPIV